MLWVGGGGGGALNVHALQAPAAQGKALSGRLATARQPGCWATFRAASRASQRGHRERARTHSAPWSFCPPCTPPAAMSDSDDVTLDSLGASGPAVGGSKGKGTKRRRSQASYKEPGSEDDEAFVEAPTAAKVRLRPCAAACRWLDHAAWCPLPLQKPRSKTPSKAASAAKKAAPAKKAASAKKKPVAGKKKAAAGKKKPAAKKAAEVKAGKVRRWSMVTCW